MIFLADTYCLLCLHFEVITAASYHTAPPGARRNSADMRGTTDHLLSCGIYLKCDYCLLTFTHLVKESVQFLVVCQHFVADGLKKYPSLWVLIFYVFLNYRDFSSLWKSNSAKISRIMLILDKWSKSSYFETPQTSDLQFKRWLSKHILKSMSKYGKNHTLIPMNLDCR